MDDYDYDSDYDSLNTMIMINKLIPDDEQVRKPPGKPSGVIKQWLA